MQTFIGDIIARFNLLKEDIIKESLLEHHKLEPTEENLKRVTRIVTENLPEIEDYYLDSSDITNWGNLDNKKFVASFKVSFKEFSLHLEANTPVQNSKHKNERIF